MKASIDLEAYKEAQQAIQLLKCAIVRVLENHPKGLKNSEIGRLLGVNADFLADQQGWFQYTVLKIMELEKTVQQASPRGPWRLTQFADFQEPEEK